MIFLETFKFFFFSKDTPDIFWSIPGNVWSTLGKNTEFLKHVLPVNGLYGNTRDFLLK